MASPAPERPPSVPDGGLWNPALRRWEVASHDAGGARDGECLSYRVDGTLFSRCRFAGGVQEGPFVVFHPDGGVACEGIFVAGQLEGIVAAYASAASGSEPLRACCVPPAAVRLDARYEAGALVQEIFYDGGGRPLLSNGQPWPPRPPAVPEDAEFDEGGARWVRRRPARHQFWDTAGTLRIEIDFAGGARVATRMFDDAGRVVEAGGFMPDGRRHGPFRRRFTADAPSPYADPRIREEDGDFDGGQAVGRWTFRDEAGHEIRSVARGLAFPIGAETDSPVFAAKPSAGGWQELARSLRAAGRLRETLGAAARAAAASGDGDALVKALAEQVVPLAPEVAVRSGEALVQATDATPAAILDGLIGGADAAAALRALAAVLPGAHPAAPDFVAAALLLAPERRLTHLTRALVRFQHGDEAGARADAAIVAEESPEAAASLSSYLKTTFRPFQFWPAHEPLSPDPELADVPAGVMRTLDEVQSAAALYATRLRWVRTAVVALAGAEAGQAPWLPPDLSALLPSGPIALRQTRVSVPGEDGETVEIEIDEGPATEQIGQPGLGVPALLGEAQADWGALCWLCWSVGLDRVARPAEVAEPPLFAVAMKRIVTRCWRARDRLTTGGLLARTNSVPGFDWQGIDVDALPQHLARAAAEEYLRARAIFLWLADPSVVSPFQLDLRDDL